MVRGVFLVKYETRLQSMLFKFLKHLPTWDVYKFYNLKVEHPHWSRLELRIPCLSIDVYVSNSLCLSFGIPTSINEVL